MRIRWKLLILLLATAAAPLLFTGWWGQRSVSRMGAELADRSRAILTENAEDLLVQLVSGNAHVLRREADTVEFLLRDQARAVERRLATTPEESDRPRVWFARDFETDGDRPPGAARSEKHAAMAPDGRTSPRIVSYETQSFWISPGADLEAIESDLVRLDSMTPAYRFINESRGELIFWQYTALESGLHSTYPGHGNFPAEYDPRNRLWYRLAREADELVWTMPIVDASSGRVLMTVAAPIRDPEGRFAGVTAIDLLITDVIGLIDIPQRWVGSAEAMIVGLSAGDRDADADAENDFAPLTVIARQEYATEGGAWNAPLEPVVLDSADDEARQAVIDDLRRGRTGARRLPYEGEDAIWAYSPTGGQNGAIVMVVPTSAVTAQARSAEAFVLSRTARHIVVAFSTGAVLLIIVGAVSALASRAFTRPIRRLSEAANELAAGDFNARANVETGDEIEDLANVFNQMGPRLRDEMRQRQSLELAREVQQRLLPQGAPDVGGVDISGGSIYCDETGGDYFDYLETPKLGAGCFGIAVGDVTGHGIAAALLMTTARALLHSGAEVDDSLETLFNRMNARLARDSGDGRFMTLFLACVNPATRRIGWVSAGHDPAIVYDPIEDSFDELPGDDIPLGIDPDWKFTERRRDELPAGGVVVIGTDGIWEARNPIGEMFGKDRLREIVRERSAETAGEICGAVTDHLVAFREGRLQEDDVTLVVMKLDDRRPGVG